MSRTSADAIAAAGLLLLGLLLCLIGWGLLAQWKDAFARQQEPGVEELLAAAAGIAGAGIVVWWSVSLAFAAMTALLARKGRTRAAAATQKLSPAFMQRLVLGALSIQLLSGPVAHAAVSAPGPVWAPTHGQSSSAPTSPGTAEAAGDPGEGAVTGGTTAGEATAGGTDVPSRAQSAVEATPPSTVHPGWQPAAPVVHPGMLAAPASRAAAEAAGPEVEGITVQAGDTLWDIAARHLGYGASDLDVALQWPRWYEANQALIGQNPDVLLPGQILQPPSSGHK